MNIDTEQGRVLATIANDAAPPSVVQVLDDLSEAVVVADSRWRVRYMNDAARRLVDMAARTASAVRVSDIAPLYDARGRPVFGADGKPTVDLGGFCGLLSLRCASGTERAVELRVRSGTAGHWTLVLRDRTRETGLVARISHQASHDALTGLANRALFERTVASAKSQRRVPAADSADRPGALLYLDIDRFGIINDTCGYEVGDEILRRLATALTTQVRDTDIIARLGSDVFALFLPERSVNDARVCAARLRSMLGRMGHNVGNECLAFTVSIGIVMLDQLCPGSSLLGAADLACRAAKERGGDRVEVFGAATGGQQQSQMRWVTRVRRACDEQRFVLYRQPIVPLHEQPSARPHFELLLRMVEDNGKIVMPAEFIPAAERYKIMSRVDRWTIRYVLSELVWREGVAPQAPYTLSVNVSGTSLRDPTFRRDVLALIDRNPVAAGTLCFEITETADVGDIEPVAAFMHALKARGCLFSLDDFGTGTASFAYLKALPVDFMKIDGQFVHGVGRDPASTSMVRAFCDIASTLGIRTVGERVEDAQTADALRDIGVEFAQGFYFERPRKLLNRLAFAEAGARPLASRVAV